MSSRLSSVGRTPIADRIKIFDNSPINIRTPPVGKPSTPTPPPASPSPTNLKPVPAVSTPARSQFSAKDPSHRISPPSSSASSKKASPSSSKGDLSRSPSNASTKSNSSSSAAAAGKISPAKSGFNNSVNGRGTSTASPSASRRTGGVAASTSSPSPNKRATATNSKSGSNTHKPLTPSNSKSRSDESQVTRSARNSIKKESPTLGKPELTSSAVTALPPEVIHETVLLEASGGVDAAGPPPPLPSRAALRSPPAVPQPVASIDAVDRAVIVTGKRDSVVSVGEAFERKNSLNRKMSAEAGATTPRKVSQSSTGGGTTTPTRKISEEWLKNNGLAGTSSNGKPNGDHNGSLESNSISQDLSMENKENSDSNSSYTHSLTKDTTGEKNDSNSSLWSNRALNNHTTARLNKVKSQKAMRLDVELRDEKISGLQRELEEMAGAGGSEEEARNLKKQKLEVELRLKDQEEELDDLASQVQALESSKAKLEQQIIGLKKEHRRELTGKEDELEDARAAANKKVKLLEQQLEQEHEERLSFVRERHELEGKMMTLQDMLERSGDEEQVSKLKRDLKRTKALLRDAQTLLEKNHGGGGEGGASKVVLRQLKNQLEDAEFARTAAMKARQNAELELADTQQQLEEVSRSKQDLEDRHLRISREKAELASQLQENEEEFQDVMRKYKASVAAVSTDQITIQDQQQYIQELEEERNKLRESVAELSSRLGSLEGENVSTSQHKRLELKIRELESKLELEVTTRGRLETQISRLKETIDKSGKSSEDLRIKEQNSQEANRKLARQLRDLREDYTTLQGKETELAAKKGDLEKQLELAEAEALSLRSDIKLSLKRIEDLQLAMAGDLDTDSHSNSDDSSDDEMSSFIQTHRRVMSVQREKESLARSSLHNGSRNYSTLSSLDETKDSISELDESHA